MLMMRRRFDPKSLLTRCRVSCYQVRCVSTAGSTQVDVPRHVSSQSTPRIQMIVHNLFCKRMPAGITPVRYAGGISRCWIGRLVEERRQREIINWQQQQRQLTTQCSRSFLPFTVHYTTVQAVKIVSANINTHKIHNRTCPIR